MFENHGNTKITCTKKLRADEIQGMLATTHLGIFYVPVYTPKTEILKYIKA
jgi:hypothetical protein